MLISPAKDCLYISGHQHTHIGSHPTSGVVTVEVALKRAFVFVVA